MKKIALVCMILAVVCLAYAGTAGKLVLPVKKSEIGTKQEVVKPVESVVEKPVKLDDAALKAMEGDIYSPVLVTSGSLDDCAVPFPEGFEGLTAPALPACWDESNANGDSYTWDSYSDGIYAHGGTMDVRIHWNSSAAMDDWLFSPGVTLAALTEYQLKFWYKSSDSFPERLEVKYGTTQDVAGMTTTLVSSFTFQTSTWTESVTNFTPGAGTFYIGFHGISDADMFYLYLDDIDLVLAPTGPGRCCYYPDDPCTPVCVENLQGDCQALGGTWTMGETCGGTFPYGCAVPAATDMCCNAGAIASFPFYVFIDNTAMTDDATGYCGTSAAPIHGVWYTFVGDGYFYTANTCGVEGTSTDTRLQVFSGDCDALVCVVGNDDAYALCGGTYDYRSYVTWCAEQGVTYYIHVGSYSTYSLGTFPLNVTKGTSCSEGRCCYLDSVDPDPENPLCAVNTQADCDLLSGDWTAGEVCLPDFPYGCELPFHGEDCSDPAATITTLPFNASGHEGLVNDYDYTTAYCISASYDGGYDVIYELIIDEDGPAKSEARDF